MGGNVKGYYALDMSKISFASMVTGSSQTATQTQHITDFPNGLTDNFMGYGFAYNLMDRLTPHGIVTDLEQYYGSGTNYMIHNISLSVADMLNAASTITLADDIRVLKNALNGRDVVYGGDFRDTLFAGAGDDRIYGGAGNDIILSGRGIDGMTGGKGKDFFAFADVSHSSPQTEVDWISDFSDEDIIDLSKIDADQMKRGNNAFTFIGSNDFTGQSGELRFDDLGTQAVITADIDGDKRADFEVELDQFYTFALLESDFLL